MTTVPEDIPEGLKHADWNWLDEVWSEEPADDGGKKRWTEIPPDLDNIYTATQIHCGAMNYLSLPEQYVKHLSTVANGKTRDRINHDLNIISASMQGMLIFLSMPH